MPQSITEIKRHLDGRVQQFHCDLLHQDSEVTIIRFHATGTPYASRIHHSDGFFWPGRNYLMYQLFGSDNEVAGYRFDVCKDVRCSPDAVEFTDLLLDVVVSGEGTVEVQDEDEVDAAHAAGQLTPTDLAVIIQARSILVDEVASIISEAQALRRRLTLGSGA
ncbi:MAG: DUF402 domain-containing protein [Dehalococcoidia bacterium]|nr:DUF402 domain-containing protein [Dehalococcoidia bacterium]